jgi:hypothetical protein
VLLSYSVRAALPLLMGCGLAVAMLTSVPAAVPIRWFALEPFGYGQCALPCWGGVHVGQTRLEDVQPLLSNALSVDLAEFEFQRHDGFFWAIADNEAVTGLVWSGSEGGGVVRSMTIQAAIPLVVFHEALGDPVCASLLDARTRSYQFDLVLVWVHEDVVVETTTRFYSWTQFSPLTTVSEYSAIERDLLGEMPFLVRAPCLRETPADDWLGYALEWRYHQRFVRQRAAGL